MALPAEHPTETLPPTLTPEQGRELFDHVAREVAGVSGEEFLTRYDAGEFDDLGEDTPEGFKLQYLMLLIPFGRQEARRRQQGVR